LPHHQPLLNYKTVIIQWMLLFFSLQYSKLRIINRGTQRCLTPLCTTAEPLQVVCRLGCTVSNELVFNKVYRLTFTRQTTLIRPTTGSLTAGRPAGTGKHRDTNKQSNQLSANQCNACQQQQKNKHMPNVCPVHGHYGSSAVFSP